ncbi:carboxymuconolactone decarboxylase [Xanthobacter autotrophicus DSM 431]|uniref:carboxymuconolactone decarboxylase n=1 Tax=Xanthobacter nonsaccharivorans TaxID=3119912 RepID=UPI003728FD65
MASLPDPTATLTGAGRAIYEDILARRQAKGVDHLGPYIPLLNHPQLARLIEQLGYFYKYDSALPRDAYQLVVLILAARSGVTFVWDDHVAAARAAGLPEAVIDAVKTAGGAPSAPLPAPFDTVAGLADAAFAFRSIPEALQAQAISRFGVTGLLELVTLCGFYTMMGMVNACFDVPLPHRKES